MKQLVLETEIQQLISCWLSGPQVNDQSNIFMNSKITEPSNIPMPSFSPTICFKIPYHFSRKCR